MIPFDPTELLLRGEWQARPAARALYLLSGMSEWNGIEVHHSVTPQDASPAAAARSIQNFHLDGKGWRDIFYNVLFHADGTIIEGRPMLGLSTGLNDTHLTCCFIGNYENDELTDAQVLSFRRFRRWALGQGVAPSLTVHGDRASTLCPGMNIRGRMGELSTVTVTPPPIPPIDVGAPEPSGGASLEEYIAEMQEHRTETRKVAASLRRMQEDAVELAETAGRQADRAQRELERVDQLLEQLGRSD